MDRGGIGVVCLSHSHFYAYIFKLRIFDIFMFRILGNISEYFKTDRIRTEVWQRVFVDWESLIKGMDSQEKWEEKLVGERKNQV